MLVIPREQLVDLLESIIGPVRSVIRNDIFIPLDIFSIVMIILVSFILRKISVYITEPIIDLYSRIQEIITKDRSEKVDPS